MVPRSGWLPREFEMAVAWFADDARFFGWECSSSNEWVLQQ